VSRRFAARFFAAALGVLALSGLLASRTDAATAVLSKDGTLYEVYPATYGTVVQTTDGNLASQSVLALRITPPGGVATTEIVSGTGDRYDEIAESIAFEDTTQTVFVVYTRLQGFFSSVRVAIRRAGAWADGSFLPNLGYYISMNPAMVVARQSYLDTDASGQPVQKTRSIVSIVWWEETSLSQARYAALFVEDGVLAVDGFQAYNLNELAGASGPTDTVGIPASAYMWPSVQRDPGSNGGVIVSFANLSARTQQVLRLGFPDNYTTPATSTAPATPSTGGRAANSRTTPIGRSLQSFALPMTIDLPYALAVGTIISPTGLPTYFWSTGSSLLYLRGDATSLPAVAIPLRPDFGVDRAFSVLRDLSERE
jgi:hypothetical protein